MKNIKLLIIIITLSTLFTACAIKKESLSRQHFVEQTAKRLSSETEMVIKALFADMDSDGDLDLIVLTSSDITNKQLLFFQNNGRGHFEDDTLTRIPELYKKFSEVKLVDIDDNGFLDIILLGDTPDKSLTSTVSQRISADNKRDYILINNMNGVFIDETASRLPSIGNGYSEIKFADIDNDKDTDLLIYGDNVTSLLFINIGNGIFQDATLSRLPTQNKGIMEALLIDANGDDFIDIFFAMKNKKNVLYISNEEGIFTDETELFLPKIIDNSTDAASADIDNDGDIDIIITVDELSDEEVQTKEQMLFDTYKPFSNTDFENGVIANGWLTEGNAWRIWSMNENIRLDATKPTPEDGSYYSISFTTIAGGTGEAATGKLCSQDFTIPFAAKTLSFSKTGWDNQFGTGNKNFFYLRKSSDRTSSTTCTPSSTINEPLRVAYPPQSDYWQIQTWDIGDIANETVYFEAVDDNNRSSYGSIGLDNLRLSNASNNNDRSNREENYFLINNGDGTFRDKTIDMQPIKSSYSVDTFDIDNDNDLDIIIEGFFGATLLVNDGNGNFRDDTFAKLPQDTRFNEPAFGDIDFDGDIDIVVVQQEQVNILVNELNPKVLLEDIQRLKDSIVSFSKSSYKKGGLDFFITELGGKGKLIDILTEAEKTQSLELYKTAQDTLKLNFLERTDGCSLTGEPDENDWIIECEVQAIIYSISYETIEFIKSIITSSATAN